MFFGNKKRVDVAVEALPLQCPPPEFPAWNLHPRVFLDFSHSREAACPYCGTCYVLTGEAPKGH